MLESLCSYIVNSHLPPYQFIAHIYGCFENAGIAAQNVCTVRNKVFVSSCLGSDIFSEKGHS